MTDSVFQILSRPESGNLGVPQALRPLFADGEAPTLASWERCREGIVERWGRVLGHPAPDAFDRSPRHVRDIELPECDASLFDLPTSSRSLQRVLLMRLRTPQYAKAPVAIVPFYNPDLMAGYDLETLEAKDGPSVHFARHLVQQGYVVVCGQAFPYNTVPDPQSDAGFAWWHAGTTKLLADNPEWTGMGKLIHDTRIATDFLLSQPGVDAERLVAIGHSLGGKMAFYSGCLDERVRAIVSSDFGIGFDFTNWDAPWYLGDWVKAPNPPVGHHELLALHAPNPFLVLAGDADRLESWQYLEAARPAYELLGAPEALAMMHHATGHRPPAEVTRTAYVWLAEQFGLPEVSYKI